MLRLHGLQFWSVIAEKAIRYLVGTILGLFCHYIFTLTTSMLLIILLSSIENILHSVFLESKFHLE